MDDQTIGGKKERERGHPRGCANPLLCGMRFPTCEVRTTPELPSMGMADENLRSLDLREEEKTRRTDRGNVRDSLPGAGGD